MHSKTRISAAAAALALWAGAAHAAPPATITYGGFLTTDTGAPVTIATDLTFRFYDSAIGGSQVGTADVVTVTPSADGFFTAIVGTTIAGFPSLFQNPVFMSVQVQGDAAEMAPRIPITSVPSALAVANFTPLLTAANTWTATQTFSGQVAMGYERVQGASVTISNPNGVCPNYANGTCFWANATATCPVGKRVIGGGCLTAGIIGRQNVEGSFPSADNQWFCYGNAGAATGSSLQAYAICARMQ
jgi:hypothetical protein